MCSRLARHLTRRWRLEQREEIGTPTAVSYISYHTSLQALPEEASHLKHFPMLAPYPPESLEDWLYTDLSNPSIVLLELVGRELVPGYLPTNRSLY